MDALGIGQRVPQFAQRDVGILTDHLQQERHVRTELAPAPRSPALGWFQALALAHLAGQACSRRRRDHQASSRRAATQPVLDIALETVTKIGR